jgi:RNase P/RNase MRP subunit p30
MFTDIVLPNENEKDFIALADRLGIRSICFCYYFVPKTDPKQYQERLKKLQEKTGIKLSLGFITKLSDTLKARKFADLLLVKASPENRETLEKKEVDCIYELENGPKPDKMHYANAGLNQVLCAVAKDNATIITFSFSMLLNADSLRRATLMGRIRQNIRLCRKYKVSTAFASFARAPYEIRPEHDFLNLGTAFGMHPKDAQAAISSVSKKIEENQLIKAGKYFGEGIVVVDKPIKQSKTE